MGHVVSSPRESEKGIEELVDGRKEKQLEEY